MKKLVFVAMVFLSVSSCKKEQILTNVEETIYVRNEGADIPVYLRGNFSSDVIMIVVHGGPGGNGLEYRTGPWTIDLEKKYGIAYWDQRGQGMSHGKFDKSKVTILQMALDLDAVISTLKHKYGKDVKVFAFGHSWGGTLTAKYMTTANLQNNLAGWIESNGAHDMPKNDIESVKLFIKVSDEQINLGNSIPKWEETKNWALGINLNNISSKQSLEINQKAFEVENWLLEDGVLQKRASGGNSGASLNSPINPVSSQINGSLTNGQLSKEVSKASYTNDLFKVTLPTLIMTGKYDFVVAPELSQDAYNLISSTNKKLVVFDNSGHSPMSHEPEKYTNELIQFIDANK